MELSSGLPAVVFHDAQSGGEMFTIGIDPHRGSHTVVVLDERDDVVDEFCVNADRRQRDRLLAWSARFEPRVWAIEGASGTGALLAQQLVACGEHVVDVPPALSARVRLLDSGRSDKTDRHDARSAAIVARRHRSLRQVRPEDHIAVLRLLAKRHHDLVAARTRAACRFHTTLCHLAEGHFPRRMTARQGAAILARVRPTDAISIERKAVARDLLAEVRRCDRDLTELLERIKAAVAASGSTVTDVYGVGPIAAAYLLGYTGDVARFPSAGHYARYNGTAPIEASSGPVTRHRFNPRGNRQLNHALHIAAVTQVGHDTPGRCLLPRQARREEAAKGSHAGPETADQRRRLPPAARRHPPLTPRAREGNQGRLTSSSAAG
jgi:transposase